VGGIVGESEALFTACQGVGGRGPDGGGCMAPRDENGVTMRDRRSSLEDVGSSHVYAGFIEMSMERSSEIKQARVSKMRLLNDAFE